MVDSPGLVVAHGLGRVYELPLPLPYYLGGAAATVLASFAIRAIVGRTRRHAERVVASRRAARIFVQLLEDVVILEGTVDRITDSSDPRLAGIDDAYEAKYDMRHGPPVWLLRPRIAFAWTNFPKDATRWRF